MKILFFLTLLLANLIFPCMSQDVQSSNPKIQFDPRASKKIISELDLLKTLSTDDARKFIVEKENKLNADLAKDYTSENLIAQIKGNWFLYTFIRYYCDVPEYSDDKNNLWKGGWVGIPSKNNEINILYPLKKSESGWEIIGDQPVYTGSVYSASAEFDYFISKYGRREFK